MSTAPTLPRERNAMLFGLAAVLLWSTVATAFKLGLRVLAPAQLLAGATTVSLVALALILAVQGKLGQLTRTSRRDLMLAAALGLLNPWAYYLILFEAYDRLPAQVAQPLNYTWALTLTYLSVPLRGHRLRRVDLVAGVVCYGGVLVISRGNATAAGAAGTVETLGVALALGSTVIWALYWLSNARSRLDPVVMLFWNFAAGLLPVWAVAVARHGWVFPAAGVPAAVYVGTVEMGVTFVLWLTALRLTANTSRVANLIFLSPFVSLVFIGTILGETIRPATVAGLLLIVGGLTLQNRRRANGAGT
ncbi:MAG: DMT family transporter [Candidatus Krumholzibacteriia bacterium]